MLLRFQWDLESLTCLATSFHFVLCSFVAPCDTRITRESSGVRAAHGFVLSRLPHSTSLFFPLRPSCDVAAQAAPEATPLDEVAFTGFLSGGLFVRLEIRGSCDGVFGSGSRGYASV